MKTKVEMFGSETVFDDMFCLTGDFMEEFSLGRKMPLLFAYFFKKLVELIKYL